jgi:ferredoxin/flavodoxin
VAESIAAGLRAAEYQIDLCNMKDEQPPDMGGYDLLGVGAPTYYYRPPFNVMGYVNSLPDLDGLPAFVFVLHGTYRGDAGNAIRHALARKGAQEAGYFHCRGADYFLGYLKEGYLFSPDHPTAEELTQAEAFGREVAAHAAGQPYARPEDDRPPAMIYRLERFLANRWLGRQVYSRLFRVDAKNCNACGLCIELCPIGNITEGKGGRPVWGRNCLLCMTCEMKCPKDAITSPASWPLMRPFMIHNVRRASRDPSLDYVQVTHSHGRTQRV